MLSTHPAPSSATRTVLLVVFPGFQLLDATGPAEVFAAAREQFAVDSPPYVMRTVSEAGGLMRSSTGLELNSETLPDPASLAGCTLIIAGGDGVQQAMLRGSLAPWLAQVASVSERCCSVCTGAFLLAQAGLLDGRNVVTHWRYAGLLGKLFPSLQVIDDALYMRDQQFYSSAGVTAGIDLCLSLVEEDHGHAASLHIAKGLVVHLRRAGGQRQFSAELLSQQAPPASVSERLAHWLREHMAESVDIELIAHALQVSTRTLHRHCQAELGISPSKLLMQLRLERVCELLEAQSIGLKRIAQRTGFVSEYNLRRAFVQALGVTPGDYRQRFRGEPPYQLAQLSNAMGQDNP